jgi:hypothetical protein
MQILSSTQVNQIIDFELLFKDAQKHKQWDLLDKDDVLKMSLFSDTVSGYKFIFSDDCYKTPAWITDLPFDYEFDKAFVVYMLNDKKKKPLDKIRNFYTKHEADDQKYYEKVPNKE